MKERDLLKSQHTKELDELREATEARVRLECEKAFRLNLLTFSRFLKAAAGRRGEGEEDLDLEGKAFEGVLSNVYTGDTSAVEAIEKLINGSAEKARDWSGELDITCELYSSRLEICNVLRATFRRPHKGAHDPRSPCRRRGPLGNKARSPKRATRGHNWCR